MATTEPPGHLSGRVVSLALPFLDISRIYPVVSPSREPQAFVSKASNGMEEKDGHGGRGQTNGQLINSETLLD